MPQFLAQRVGHRAPDGAIAKGLKVIEHVVEHAVPKRAQIGPVGGIKTLHGRHIGCRFVAADHIPVVKPVLSYPSAVRTARSSNGWDGRSLHGQAHDIVIAPKRPADILRFEGVGTVRTKPVGLAGLSRALAPNSPASRVTPMKSCPIRGPADRRVPGGPDPSSSVQ